MATNLSVATTSVGGPVLSPVQIIDALDQAILDALASGDLKYYESTSEEVLDSGISYQVRLCPALAQKHQVRAPTPNIAPDSHEVLKVVETIVKTDPFLPPFNTLL
ncbi:hypothetical protein FRC19_007516, partial [Serendipita sp. 401]